MVEGTVIVVVVILVVFGAAAGDVSGALGD